MTVSTLSLLLLTALSASAYRSVRFGCHHIVIIPVVVFGQLIHVTADSPELRVLYNRQIGVSDTDGNLDVEIEGKFVCLPSNMYVLYVT